MQLFIAQNHSAMVHLPVASAVLAAVSAIAALIWTRKELGYLWAVLSIVAFVTVSSTVTTGLVAARGRYNEEGKPYVQSGLFVPRAPANERIWRHQALGIVGGALSGVLALLGVRLLRGKAPNGFVVAVLAVTLALVWAVGAHTGGAELWGPETFPAFK